MSDERVPGTDLTYGDLADTKDDMHAAIARIDTACKRHGIDPTAPIEDDTKTTEYLLRTARQHLVSVYTNADLARRER